MFQLLVYFECALLQIFFFLYLNGSRLVCLWIYSFSVLFSYNHSTGCLQAWFHWSHVIYWHAGCKVSTSPVLEGIKGSRKFRGLGKKEKDKEMLNWFLNLRRTVVSKPWHFTSSLGRNEGKIGGDPAGTDWNCLSNFTLESSHIFVPISL